jgi:hypothetical protein
LPAGGTPEVSEVVVVRFIMAMLIFPAAAAPAGVIAAKLEGMLRGATKELVQKTQKFPPYYSMQIKP